MELHHGNNAPMGCTTLCVDRGNVMDELHHFTMGGSGRLYNSVNLKITELIESHSDLEAENRGFKIFFAELRTVINRNEYDTAKQMINEVAIRGNGDER